MLPIKYLTLFFITLTVFVPTHSKSVKQDEESKQELEAYIEEAKKNVNPRYRLTYHVSAPVGWINDPNGFSFYRGRYHLFYQYYPYDSKWGPMHWGHVSSTDLATWEYLPTALIPEEEMCFSGSAVVDDNDRLVLMYTGRLNTDEDPFFTESQYLAFSDDGVNFTKYEGNPVLQSAPNGSPDFRDPKAWRHGDYWYVVIGSQNEGHGRVLLYRSPDLIQWEFLSVLGESEGDMGYMWECPDFFELDGKYVLLMSPQGLEAKGDRFMNLHQTGYIIGDFSYDTFEFTPIEEFKEIDFGHDFYAATTTEVDGRRLLIAWFGMWEREFPEAEDGWAGAMTIVRSLKLDDKNRLIMEPISEMESLRQDLTQVKLQSGDSYDFGKAVELLVTGSVDEKISLLFEGRDGGAFAEVSWNPAVGKVVIDRNDGDIRQVEWEPADSFEWRIFLDTSSIELFCGGEVVFSTRVYALGGWRVSNRSSQTLNIRSYDLKQSIFS
ncbi:Sucrose-6-phosphate hydrolase [Eumeta japonica]|uniref:Sucrose-6-phosphate hydrolase n=1 Tax=Eumeta variegata TaxID=151549 RepID=A0A4C1XGI1_EUMVA|nr:Sucrose-6-phosphate hydrolase [Eumeta japonica]